MDPALLLGDGDALYPVHTRLVAQRPVRFGTARREHRFLQPAERSLREREDVHLPSPPLAKPRVHPKEIGGEQRGFISSGSGADFYDGIPIVERIAGGQQLRELRLEPVDLGPEAIDVGARELGELGVFVGEDFLGLTQLGLETLDPLVGLPDFVELGVFATELLEFGRIPRGGGVGQFPGDLLRPRERLAESGLQRISSLW